MERTRQYHRRMRAKHIKRKKQIVSHYPAFSGSTYYKHDDQFSKGKIHCSCPLCKEKAYFGKHVPTMQEQRSYISKKDMWNEYVETIN